MPHQDACSHCGELLEADVSFCRHCGSSDEDGWRDEDHELLGDDDFDYDDFVRDNFGDRHTNTRTRPIWRIVAIVLLALTALGYLLA